MSTAVGGPRFSVHWARFIATFVVAAAAVALLTGIPTVLIPNDWFSRMTPAQSYAYPVWVAASALSGILAASYWGVRARVCATPASRTAGGAGALLSWLAIGCPVCNKMVVAAVGTSGAFAYFAPVQPWLAAVSIASLLAAVAWRWRALLLLPSQRAADG